MTPTELAIRHDINDDVPAVNPQTGNVVGQLKNISHLGMMVVTEGPLPPGQSLVLGIGKPPVALVHATPVWTQKSTRHSPHYETGFSLKPYAPRDKAALKHLIQKYGKPIRTPVAPQGESA